MGMQGEQEGAGLGESGKQSMGCLEEWGTPWEVGASPVLGLPGYPQAPCILFNNPCICLMIASGRTGMDGLCEAITWVLYLAVAVSFNHNG